MIYDCFTFFNEVELLRIRIDYLSKVIDKFVICESNYTHAGNKKDLCFPGDLKQNKKIIYLVDDSMPNNGKAWDNENHQREYLRNGLTDLKDDDFLIIGDLDEIPSVDGIKDSMAYDKLTIFRHKTFYYYLNTYSLDWNGAKGLFGKWFRYSFNKSPQKVRDYWLTISSQEILSGWHWGYLGGIDKVRYKMENLAHQENNSVEIIGKTISDIDRMIDCKGRPMKVIDIDNSFPEIICNNIDRYKAIGYIK